MKTVTINEWLNADEVKPWEGRPCLVESDLGTLHIAIYNGHDWVDANTFNRSSMVSIKVRRFYIFTKPPQWHSETERYAEYSEAWACRLNKTGNIIMATDGKDELYFPTKIMAARHAKVTTHTLDVCMSNEVNIYGWKYKKIKNPYAKT